MSSLNDFLDRLSEEKRHEFFIRVAVAALQRYSIGACRSAFLQHNSGITYHVESADGRSHYLLKVHEPVGTGPRPSLEKIQACMEFLDWLTQTSGLVLQTPIANAEGMFVTKVPISETGETLFCTLQNWIEGEHLDGDFTIAQAEVVGSMMARLHQVSSQWRSLRTAALEDYGEGNLSEEVEQLQKMVDASIISSTQYLAIEEASQRIRHIASVLGTDAGVYGPIHGDLHHENILFAGQDVYPIDFDSLRNSYYLFDLGTTLYHILYQRTEYRSALVDGYSSVRKRPNTERQCLEEFITWSAINNLAFQSTIPRQVQSKLFARNMHQLTDEFCTKLLRDEPFALQ